MSSADITALAADVRRGLNNHTIDNVRAANRALDELLGEYAHLCAEMGWLRVMIGDHDDRLRNLEKGTF